LPATRRVEPSDLDANIEATLNRRCLGLVIDAGPAPVSPPARDPSPRKPSRPSGSKAPGIEAPVTALLMLSTLSVGYTTAAGGRPPAATACQQRASPAPSFRSRECQTLQASVRTPPRDVAATDPKPTDPAKQEARVPSKRRQKPRWISHRGTVRSRLAPRGSEEIPSASAAWTRATAGQAGHQAWTFGATNVSPRSRRSSMLVVERRQTEHSRATDGTSQGPCCPITSSAGRPRRNADTNQRSATADWTRPFTHMTPASEVLPPRSRQKRRERPWRCAGIHQTLDARSPGCPGSLAPRLPSARRHRQSRCWQRPSAALGERSPDSVRSLGHGERAATGLVDVAIGEDPAGFERPRR
jgi:hypothetical protein